ncbi:MAG: phosphodiesterase [Dehalococcoidia bacterium]|jgi:hypothetical protein|nr:MAG: phosphodiesterase [Dehalococcoidia bacterium]
MASPVGKPPLPLAPPEVENAAAVAAVRAATFSRRFRRPLFESYSFARLPAAISRLLTGDGPLGLPEDTLQGLVGGWDTVILLFVDAFGWDLFQRHRDRLTALRRFDRDGVVSPLTSQFPSTTAAHVTTLHTGLPVGRHGVVEWSYYEPALDRLINPLPFRAADGVNGTDTLLAAGVDPAAVFDWETVYPRLAASGVEAIAFQPASIAGSVFSQRVLAGATSRPYSTVDEGLALLLDETRRPGGKRLLIFYYSGIDTTAHLHGPNAPATDAEVSAFWATVERRLLRHPANAAGRTLLLVTADHGQTEANVGRPWYVNIEIPQIVPLLRTGSDGRPLAPGGSPPDLLLYVKPDHVDEVADRLACRIEGIGEVHRIDDLIAEGFFGPPPHHPLLRARLGDLVALAYPGEAIWWYEPGVHWVRFRGHHGGLSPAEMDTLLLALPLF